MSSVLKENLNKQLDQSRIKQRHLDIPWIRTYESKRCFKIIVKTVLRLSITIGSVVSLPEIYNDIIGLMRCTDKVSIIDNIIKGVLINQLRYLSHKENV